MEFSQEEYEYYLNWVRDSILNFLDAIEEEINADIHPESGNGYVPCLEALLNLLLIVSDTDKGERLFIRLLEYAKHKHQELANKYWELFDDRDNLFKRRYYSLKVNYTDSTEKSS